MARPRPNSSSSAANVPGTGSPSMARCPMVREVENPSAPASIASVTNRPLALMSSGVAGPVWGAGGAVGDLAAHIDRVLLHADRVQVLGIGLPAPGDALGQRGAGDVLDTLHQLDQPLLPSRPDRGKPDAAVAGDHRGDPVSAGRLEQAVPAHLAVVVGVDVDEYGGHHFPGVVNSFGGLTGHLVVAGATADNVDDGAVLDGDIRSITLRARAVHDGATDDLQVEHEGYSLSPCAADAKRAAFRYAT